MLTPDLADRMLSNPWAEPPSPKDWEIQPTYPKRSVPYYLAPMWDAHMVTSSISKGQKKAASAKSKKSKTGSVTEEVHAKIPKELRNKLKRAKAARGLLQDLEESVRVFVVNWNEKQQKLASDGLEDVDSSDEEIVFVGRNGQMSDMPDSPTRKRMREELQKEKLVFDSLADDHGASFGRWLVHSIAAYYGLETWSVTKGNPARREAYVGIVDAKMKTGGKKAIADQPALPRPLWGMV